jgi:signal transduction histidine kinase
LAAAAGIVIHNARLHGHVTRRDAALTAVHEVISAAAGDREGHEALQLVADRACQLAGADVATVALPTGAGDTLEVAVVSGAASAAFGGVCFPRAGSVSGEVITTGRPVVLTDASRDYRLAQPQVKHGHFGPAMWVPLIAYGAPVGTLSVGRTTGSTPFTDAELDLVLLFAAHASVIVEVDRSRDDARRLSILEDQERIARDLHDTVIQRLFATGLSLQSLCRLTDEKTTSRIMAAIDELDSTIRQIRTVIFGLERPTSGPSAGLRGRVLDLCAEATRVLGFEPTVGFSGPIDTVTGGELADEILAVLREALSNVNRHAAADSVAVAVTADDQTVTLTVTDDGRGLDTGTEHAGGQGLENMRVRALRQSGRFELAAGPDGGTRLLSSSPHTQ